MNSHITLITLLLLAALGQQPLHAQQNKPSGEVRKAIKHSTRNMHLLPEGEFAVGKDEFGEIVRINMLKIKDWSKVPGVKKAWIMKGFEGVEGMAFHPVISEVKDDGCVKAGNRHCKTTSREDMLVNIDRVLLVLRARLRRFYFTQSIQGTPFSLRYQNHPEICGSSGTMQE